MSDGARVCRLGINDGFGAVGVQTGVELVEDLLGLRVQIAAVVWAGLERIEACRFALQLFTLGGVMQAAIEFAQAVILVGIWIIDVFPFEAGVVSIESVGASPNDASSPVVIVFMVVTGPKAGIEGDVLSEGLRRGFVEALINAVEVVAGSPAPHGLAVVELIGIRPRTMAYGRVKLTSGGLFTDAFDSLQGPDAPGALGERGCRKRSSSN